MNYLCVIYPLWLLLAGGGGEGLAWLDAISQWLAMVEGDERSLVTLGLAMGPTGSCLLLSRGWLPLVWLDLGGMAIALLSYGLPILTRRPAETAELAATAERANDAWLQRAMSVAETIYWQEDLTTGKMRCFGKYTATGWQPGSWQTSMAHVFERHVAADDIARARAVRQTALETLREMRVEHRICLPDQTNLWMLTVGQVMVDAAGERRYLVGSSTNITARKRAEQSLVISETQLRLSLDLAQFSTWDWHIDSDRVRWNEHHFRLLGYEPGEIDPTPELWHQAVHPDDVVWVDQAMMRALCNRSEYEAEYRLIRLDGSLRWVLDRGHCQQDEQGTPVRMLGIMLDITERKQMEVSLRQSEAVKERLLKAIPDLLVWMKADGTCLGAVQGRDTQDLFNGCSVGRDQYDMLPAPLSQLRRQAVARAINTGEPQVYEQQIDIDGALEFEEVRVVQIGEDEVLTMMRNISDRKRAEIALTESERRYRLVTENMTDLVCLHHPDGRYLYLTPSCEALLGYTPQELLDRSPYDFFHVDDLKIVNQAHEAVLLDEAVSVVYRMHHKLGHYIWLETLSTPVLDDVGCLIHIQTTSREVTDRVAIEKRLRHIALHDTLTQLPNRLLLIDRLELAIARAQGSAAFQFALLFIDFDRFKVINDSLGHAVGDELLVAIAQALPTLVRASDLVARLGGDEFVILLEHVTGIDEAIALAERILTHLQSPLEIQGQQIFMSASIGIVLGGDDYQQPETVIRNADIAMYRAKATGRDGYAIFDPAMHAQVRDRLQLENDLRRALKKQEFVLFYQPVVALETLKIVGFEALLRWRHPTRGLLMPDRFIHVAEESNLMPPLGEWMLLTACQQVSEWQAQIAPAAGLCLSVNLSVKQLHPSMLLPQLKQVLAMTQIKPQTLALELTESLLVENIETTSDMLHQLQAIGVTISIDDFGTGYSSLSYLHQLPVNALKIDRSFVSPSQPNLRNQTIAESIVGLSNLLGFNAIAEGIETPQQLAWLRSLQCEYGQGFLFAPPVPAAQAEQLLRDNRPFEV
ncbi:MAG: EAL domain-containing protein [Cyanobacteria bacterium P01_H01_bin.162]